MERVIVTLGQLAVRRAPATIAALGLGSCVAVLLYDDKARVGGLAHVLLPTAGDATMLSQPARYAQSAVPALRDAVVAAGAEPRRLVARLVGGATMFSNLVAPGLISIGQRNTVAIRRGLDRLGIPVVSEAVGGDFGRSVHFDLGSGIARVSSATHGQRVF